MVSGGECIQYYSCNAEKLYIQSRRKLEKPHTLAKNISIHITEILSGLYWRASHKPPFEHPCFCFINHRAQYRFSVERARALAEVLPTKSCLQEIGPQSRPARITLGTSSPKIRTLNIPGSSSTRVYVTVCGVHCFYNWAQCIDMGSPHLWALCKR